MKKSFLLIGSVAGLLLLFLAFIPTKMDGEIPEEVNEVLMTSCYGCHNTGGKNKDAVEALNFDQWGEYRVTKKVGLLDKMGEVVEEEKMPPSKFLEHYPDKKPSDAQRKLIVDWTRDASDQLMEGN